MSKCKAKWQDAFNEAQYMMEQETDLEPKSAFKEAGRNAGIPYGKEMEKFVNWAYSEFFPVLP